MADGTITIKTELDTKSFDKQILDVERKVNDLEKIVNSPKDIGLSPNDIQDVELELEKTKNKLIQLNKQKAKLEEAKLQQARAGIENIKDTLSGIGGKVQDIVRNVGRWTLAIISVRSIYLGIRQAMSTLTQYNDELAGRIEAIRLALASALAPVVEFIVNLLTKAISLLGYVLKSLFGIDIFAKASAMSLKKASGSARELKKQLAGFDEMNVLNENGTSGAIGGLSSSLDALKDMEAQAKATWNKFRKWFIGSDKDTWDGIVKDNIEHIKRFVSTLKDTFAPVAAWIDQNVWQPMKFSFGVVIKAMEPMLKPLRDAFYKLVNEELKPLWNDFVKFIKANVVDPFIKHFEPIGRRIYNYFVPFINQMIDAINSMFGIFGIHLEHVQYKAEVSSRGVQSAMTGAIQGIINKEQGLGTQSEQTFNKVSRESANSGQTIERNIGGSIEKVKGNLQGLSRDKIEIKTNTTFIERVSNKIREITNGLRDMTNKNWGIRTTFITDVSRSVNNIFSGIREKLRGWGINLPFMATGGIVNMPNRGTLVGGAMAGEAGREGVIPLTDQQAMAELGREIGRWITINANIPVSMNGRVISRELRQVQNEQNFAYNN